MRKKLVMAVVAESGGGGGSKWVMLTWVERRDAKTPARPGWWECHPGGGYETILGTVAHRIERCSSASDHPSDLPSRSRRWAYEYKQKSELECSVSLHAMVSGVPRHAVRQLATL